MNDVYLEMKPSAEDMVGVRGAFQSVLLNINPGIGQLKSHGAGFARWGFEVITWYVSFTV